MNIPILHSPNLNLLGTREPAVCGEMTLDEINNMLSGYAREHGIKLRTPELPPRADRVERPIAVGGNPL